MPIPSPFHKRTQPLCTSYQWKDWAGYCAVRRYSHYHHYEYFAFREAAGLIDVTPLYKYEVYGPDAQALLSRMMVRDVSRLKVGRVGYTCWCDDRGKVIDDGTVSRLEDEYFRVTAAEPTERWLRKLAEGHHVTIEDSTARLAAVALQGPTSRDILESCSDADFASLKFFGVTRATLDGRPVWISRTGYTGDLGYEVWVENESALQIWDAIIEAGRPYGILPAGLDALDMTRIEAGYIMLGVDYFSAPRVTIESRKSSPFEIGLSWLVHLDRGPFVGHQALRREKKGEGAWRLVGLELDWAELESLYDSYGLPANLPAEANRNPLPVYDDERQVGQATSHTWSPLLKKSIALASVRPSNSKPGTELQIEHTVEFERRRVNARVVKTPFFDPARKRTP